MNTPSVPLKAGTSLLEMCSRSYFCLRSLLLHALLVSACTMPRLSCTCAFARNLTFAEMPRLYPLCSFPSCNIKNTLSRLFSFIVILLGYNFPRCKDHPVLILVNSMQFLAQRTHYWILVRWHSETLSSSRGKILFLKCDRLLFAVISWFPILKISEIFFMPRRNSHCRLNRTI